MRAILTFCLLSAVIFATPLVVQAAAAPRLSPAQQAIVAKYKISAQDAAALIGGGEKTGAVVRPGPAAATPAAKEPTVAAVADSNVCEDGWTFLIRSDFKDADTLGCGATPAAQATGAKLSFLDDQAGNNVSLSANGTASVVYTQFGQVGDGQGPQLFYDSFGGFATAIYAYNSNVALAKKNADTLKLGIVGELEYNRLAGGEQGFRLSAGDIHDTVAGTDVGNLALEWTPTYGKLGIDVGRELVPGIESFFNPEVAVRYDTAVGPHETVAFSGGHQALRIGPEFTWLLYGLPRTPLQSVNLRLVYDLDYEAFSARWLPYFDAAMSYNLDKDGHLALTGEYANGTDPDIGTLKDQVLVGLTGKL